MFIKVRVFPSAKKEMIVKKDEDAFDVSVKQKPENGLASLRVVEVLADYLSIKKEKIRIIKGLKSRSKIFEILE